MNTYQKGSLQLKKLADKTKVYMGVYRERKPDGTWKQIKRTFERGLTERQAQEKLDKIMKDVNAKNNGVIVRPTATFKELVENHFYPYHVKEGTRQSTMDGYKAEMKKWIIPYFGEMPLSEITAETVSGFMTKLQQE